MSEKTTILIPCSKEFKEALGEYAAKNNTDVSKVVREAAAKFIGYELSKDIIKLGRKRIYNSDEERKEAYRQDAKTKRQLERQLVELYDHNEHVRTVIALRESLIAKGVDPDA